MEDRVHGQGEHVYANGNRYKGEWVDGSITGVGVLTFADGERYGSQRNSCVQDYIGPISKVLL